MIVKWLFVAIVAACGDNRLPSLGEPSDAGGADVSPNGPDGTPDGPTRVTCDPIPAPPALPPSSATSGSRLIVRTIAEPVVGGVEIPFSVHDTQLDVDCRPILYIDGKIRCIPISEELESYFFRTFADQELTIPVLIVGVAAVPPSGALVTHLKEISAAPCFNPPPVTFPLLARVGAQRATATLFDESGTAFSISAGFSVFDLIPIPDDFVEFQDVRTELSTSIGVHELHGSDGSRLFATDLFDRTHDVDVRVWDDGVATRLFPPSTVPLGLHREPPVPAVMVGDQVFGDYCFSGDEGLLRGSSAGLYECKDLTFVSNELRTTTYRVTKSEATLYGCTGGKNQTAFLAPPITLPHLEICDTEPLTSWTAAPPVTLGSGRLTTKAHMIDGVPFSWVYQECLPVPPFFGCEFTIEDSWRKKRAFLDTTLDATCFPRLAADGVLRCLPSEQADVVFRDANCTIQVVASLRTKPPAFAALGRRHSEFQFFGNVRIFNVGAQRASEALFALDDTGTCRPGGTSFPSYDLGAEIPAASFVEFELRPIP